jgi:tyrosyl-tRNA synthetase
MGRRDAKIKTNMPLTTDLPLDDQLTLLKRGTLSIVPEDGLRAKLTKAQRSGRPLKVKLGLDPTAPDIHLGFAVVLRKLRQFQDLGHTVVLIIGDYTALIGDPSGRSATRPMLTEAQIQQNASTYVDQLAQILDKEKTIVRFNSEWLGALGFAGTIQLASKMTVAQVLTREDFKNRFESHQPISLHELLYPLSQAYDSVAIEADIEMGGQDQTFNILAGRDLQEQMGQEPQVALFMPLLVGLDGVKKMSKSLGNYIGIAEPPLEQYSKVLSLADEMMETYFVQCTDVPVAEIAELVAAARSGATNPMAVKHRLATEIVRLYHGDDAATAAGAEWRRIHSAGQFPADAPEVTVSENPIGLIALIRHCGFAASNGDARRLIEQGGVAIDGAKFADPSATIVVTDGMEFRVGKKNFARLKAA